MASSTWPLVIFTVLAQTAVGMTLALALTAADGALGTGARVTRSLSNSLRTALALMACALAASFLHLGHPGNATHALSGASSSWLSREVLLATAFVILLASAVLRVGAHASSRLFTAQLTAASLTGALLVAAMARLYMLPTVPSWRTPATPLAFAATVLLVAPPLVLATFSRQLTVHRRRSAAGRLVWFFLGAPAAAVAVKLLLALQPTPALAGDVVAFRPESIGDALPMVHWILLVAGLLALAWWILSWRLARTSRMAASLAAAFFLAAELLARALFYASYVRVGV